MINKVEAVFVEIHKALMHLIIFFSRKCHICAPAQFWIVKQPKFFFITSYNSFYSTFVHSPWTFFTENVVGYIA